MGNVEMTTIRNCAVFRDDALTHRWFDVLGPNVVKYIGNMAATPTDDTTGMPTEFTYTLVNASTFGITDVAGGAWLLTSAAADNDGVKLQLGSEVGTAGENVSFAAQYPTYFGVELAINDVDQTDVLAGFFITDTTALDGGTDGMYFRSVDGSAVVYFVMEQNENESATAVATLADDTYITLEFYYYGGNVYVYVDGVLAATIADTDDNFPNDELLRLTLEFLTGEAVANTCTVKQLRFAQIQN